MYAEKPIRGPGSNEMNWRRQGTCWEAGVQLISSAPDWPKMCLPPIN
jgi:hypothetical protein